MRVVPADLFGFGRSDKPVEEAVYSLHFHRAALMRLVEALDLRRITWSARIGAGSWA